MLLALLGELEGEAHHAVAAAAGEHRAAGIAISYSVPSAEPAADRGIFTLVVLAHDIEIDLAGRAVFERRVDPGEEPHRTQVDVLLKAAPQRIRRPHSDTWSGIAGIADCAGRNTAS